MAVARKITDSRKQKKAAWTQIKCLYFAVFGICDILVRIRIRGYVPPTKGSGDPDPTPFFSDFKDTKKSYFFITYPQAHYLQSLIYCFKDKFWVQILFCKHYFSPLNNFKRKGKKFGTGFIPYLWLTDSDGEAQKNMPDPDPQQCHFVIEPKNYSPFYNYICNPDLAEGGRDLAEGGLVRSSRVWTRSSRGWMRSSRVRMKSSREWMRSSRVWMRSSRVWMRSSRVWMRSSRACMRSSRVWMRSSRVWMRSSRVWMRSSRVWMRSWRGRLRSSRVWMRSSRVWMISSTVRMRSSRVWMWSPSLFELQRIKLFTYGKRTEQCHRVAHC
jgi:hypothetical protein